MEKDSRKEQRLAKNYIVHVGVEGFEGVALTSNISRNGMLVIFHEKIPLDEEKELEILIAAENFGHEICLLIQV